MKVVFNYRWEQFDNVVRPVLQVQLFLFLDNLTNQQGYPSIQTRRVPNLLMTVLCWRPCRWLLPRKKFLRGNILETRSKIHRSKAVLKMVHQLYRNFMKEPVTSHLAMLPLASFWMFIFWGTILDFDFILRMIPNCGDVFTCWLARVLRLLSGACKEPSAPWILMKKSLRY